MAEKTRIPPEERQTLNGHYCSWWPQRGLLQTMTTQFQGGYVFDLNKEWRPVRFDVRAIEVVRKGTTQIEAAIDGSIAKRQGRSVNTPNGPRWVIPARLWQKEPVPLMCLPCAMDRHHECDVDTGRSVMPTPCSCADEHTPAPKVKRRKVKRG